ncbi:hypothetical protein BDS110ZK4_20690 [Bradyrhizobium diazoefficiens]|uniref:Uncharacterized protein n=1 Tax=Bradyrhizobium diazoefficiens TaxID=1355477 RepID=A0A810D3S2_9BRAD|nr:hypothetical protein XF1B_75200 [Bradyrhizobium diazoefficiens]BCE51098.1 hypothetical protein XF4B_74470 [Bradyrhizobium diazoefficiens]BCE94599.1 hypothetical protein XF10B_73970 [Bradyrhizobium diazoefficiens]BCF29540.1 hypothetical protein XF14B_74920 [Bradyrhizobium diazoefficiens]
MQQAAVDGEREQTVTLVISLHQAIDADRRVAAVRQWQCRVALQDMERPCANDAPALHQNQVVGKPLDFSHVVTDVENGQRKPFMQALEKRQDLVLGGTVERGQRLVHQQQPRLRQQARPIATR